MAIDNPVVKKFCNEKIRTNADDRIRSYKEKKVVLAAYQAVADLIPNTDDIIVDGSETDGRLQITGAQVCAYVGRIAADVAAYEANDSEQLKADMKIAVNY